MKITVSKKMSKVKPGTLRSSHVEYDSEGDGATVMHHHEPEPGKKGEMWGPGPSPMKKSFSTRMEAHKHMADMAGVPAEMEAMRAHGDGDSSDSAQAPSATEGDDNEDENENQGADDDPGAQPMLSKSKKPAKNV